MAQIYGELIRAQLQLSATDLTPTATGLVYLNSTTGLKWYNGSAWKVGVDTDSSQTLAAKTLDATCSVNLSALPEIPRANISAGTADHVVINDGAGVLSSEAQLAKSRGGTGADNTSVTFPASGTIVTEDGSQTLLNKEVSSTGAMTGALQIPSGDDSDRPTPSTGMIRHNTDSDSFEGYAAGTWSSLGGGGTVDRVSQASHGFVVGDVLYLSGATYAKAIATAANTAEVVGVVSRVIDASTFEITLSGEVEGLSGLSAGDVYFLSDATAGLLTATEPSVVGYVSLPVGVASSATSLYVSPKRGVLVGATNARTEIPLSNNATTNVQDLSAYDAGELAGWVQISATASLRFYVNAQFSKNGAGTDFNLSYQTSGDTPPAGFSIEITSAGVMQVVMPNVTGFLNSSINYGLNVAAVGVSLPLSIPVDNLVGGVAVTDGTQSFSGTKSFPDNTYVFARRLTTNQTLSDSGFTQLVFNNETTDRNSEYNPSTGVFTAAVGGVYLVTSGIDVSNSSSVTRIQVSARRNGGNAQILTDLAGATIRAVGVSATVEVTAGDTLDLYVYTTGSGVVMSKDNSWITITKIA